MTLVGKESPRLLTEPLRALNRKTSLGYECIRFSEQMLGVDLLPWQQWALIHALEVAAGYTVTEDDPNPPLRFRTVLIQVARQNGKTHLLKCLALWMLYTGRARLILGSAQSLDIARESWTGSVEMAQDDAELNREIGTVRRANGEQELRLKNGARYKITASNRSAGRGLSVDLLILDELREHRDWAAWGALSKTTMARPNALTVGISNAGDDNSVVLNSLRDKALAGADSSLGIFEWSAEPNCSLDDREQWAQGNPGMNHRNGVSELAIASARGSDPIAVFRTEVLCQRVETLDGAVDISAWRACKDPSASLGELRDRVIVCLDVSPDVAPHPTHVTLAGAALQDDGRVRVEVLKEWSSTAACRAELKALLKRIDPEAIAFFPGGPAASLASDLRDLEAIEITGNTVSEACQEFAGLVSAGRIVHSGQPLLDTHVIGASKAHSGDSWRFTRKGPGHVDALYAVAGATRTVRNYEPPAVLPLPMVV